jgi:hypothetical protein
MEAGKLVLGILQKPEQWFGIRSWRRKGIEVKNVEISIKSESTGSLYSHFLHGSRKCSTLFFPHFSPLLSCYTKFLS